jgi:UV excision repair protein RAD23
MQQLAATNPALGEHIAQHPETLLQLLGGELPGGDAEGGAIPPGAIQVTAEEHQAIQRVRASSAFLHPKFISQLCRLASGTRIL